MQTSSIEVNPSGILSSDKLVISGLIFPPDFYKGTTFALKHEVVKTTTNILPEQATTDR